MTFQGCFLPNFDSFGKAVLREEDFLEINQSETRIACGGHVCQLIGTKLAIIKDFPRMLPTKFWFIWPSGYRGEIFFRNQPIRNKNCLWQPYLITDRDEMSNLYRGPAMMLPTKFRFIWPSGFREEDFFKSANQKQELPMVGMFVNESELNEQSL